MSSMVYMIAPIKVLIVLLWKWHISIIFKLIALQYYLKSFTYKKCRIIDSYIKFKVIILNSDN